MTTEKEIALQDTFVTVLMEALKFLPREEKIDMSKIGLELATIEFIPQLEN